MNNAIQFQTKATFLSQSISEQMEKEIQSNDFSLPEPSDKIVTDNVELISGKYSLDNIYNDFTLAAELIYISYNCAPYAATEGKVKTVLGTMLVDLKNAQESTIDVIENAKIKAEQITKTLNNKFKLFWKPTANKTDPKAFSTFIEKHLLPLAKSIETSSIEISTDLKQAASTFTDIIKKGEETVSVIELEIGKSSKENEDALRLIAKTKAQIEQMKVVVAEYNTLIKNFEKKAEEYGRAAKSAEDKSFVLAIIGAVSSTISNIAPIVASCYNPTASIVSQAMTEAKSQSQTGDNSKSVIIAEKESKLSEVNEKIEEARSDISAIEDLIQDKTLEKENLEIGDDKENNIAQIKSIESEIKAHSRKLEMLNRSKARFESTATNIQSALNGLSEDVKKMSSDQQDKSKTLRDMELEFNNKAEKYIQLKINETKELVEMKGVLASTEVQKDQLIISIKAMNISLMALKQSVAVLDSIAGFFLNFSRYMDKIRLEAAAQLEDANALNEELDDSQDIIEPITEMINHFMYSQSAEWQATVVVCTKFSDAIQLGKDATVKAYSNYIWDQNPEKDQKEGNNLREYLKAAPAKIETIVKERESRIAVFKSRIGK